MLMFSTISVGLHKVYFVYFQNLLNLHWILLKLFFSFIFFVCLVNQLISFYIPTKVLPPLSTHPLQHKLFSMFFGLSYSNRCKMASQGCFGLHFPDDLEC